MRSLCFDQGLPFAFFTFASSFSNEQSSISERPNEVRQILMCFPLKHVVDPVRSAQISHQIVDSRTRRTRISTLVEVNMGMVFEKQSQCCSSSVVKGWRTRRGSPVLKLWTKPEMDRPAILKTSRPGVPGHGEGEGGVSIASCSSLQGKAHQINIYPPLSIVLMRQNVQERSERVQPLSAMSHP